MSLAEAAVLLIFFAEPGFPTAGLDAGPIAESAVEAWVSASEPPPQILVVQDTAALVEALRPGRTLVWRHGGAYPAEAWPVIERFLADGGNLIHLGGPIFSHPVEGSAGFRQTSAAQVSVAKHLGLNPGGVLDVGGGTLRSANEDETTLPAATRVHLLEPRFSSTKLRRDEEGSPGPRDAHLIPLRTIPLPDDDARFPAATGSMLIDRLQGRYAGGRWALRLLTNEPTERELADLLTWGVRPPFELTVSSTTAVFHEEEKPSIQVRLNRPAEWAPRDDTPVSIEWRPPGGNWQEIEPAVIPAGSSTRAIASIPDRTPGFHRVRARIGDAPGEVAESGYWVFDRATFESGPELTIDGDLIRWDGVPQVGVGTTVMSRSVHREFLEKPNPAEWDATFAELSSLGVKWVRTGIWSGWGDFIETRGVQEDWIRAL